MFLSMDILFKRIEQFTMDLFTTGIRDSRTLASTNMSSQLILDAWN